MRRVIVVGPPGSGKTTVARRLAKTLEVPYVELDALFWKPGWQPAPAAEFRAAVADAIAGDEWVVDGNYYSVTSPVSWPRAELIVWLDLPRRSTIGPVLWRTARQMIRRRELWPGSRQTPARAFALARFAWREHAKYRARYEPLRAADDTRRWVQLTSRAAVAEWFESLVDADA